jgi:hypothetical protein
MRRPWDAAQPAITEKSHRENRLAMFRRRNNVIPAIPARYRGWALSSSTILQRWVVALLVTTARQPEAGRCRTYPRRRNVIPAIPVRSRLRFEQ